MMRYDALPPQEGLASAGPLTDLGMAKNGQIRAESSAPRPGTNQFTSFLNTIRRHC
jgi:hypothetical protein